MGPCRATRTVQKALSLREGVGDALALMASRCLFWFGCLCVVPGSLAACMDEMRSMPDTTASALAPDTSEASETDAPAAEKA